jgi:predicted peroxiredoxin
VKETKTPGKDGDILSTIEWMKENKSNSYTKMIDDVIDNGVKETFDTEFMPKAIVEDIIQNGVKETSLKRGTRPFMVNETLKNGVKETKLHKGVRPSAVEVTIKNGVSRENSSPFIPSWILVEDAIKHGVKETKTPGNGDIVSTVEWLKENNSTSYPKMIDDVIDNGTKNPSV